MNTDYWRQFLRTGSVRDYLSYRNSISSQKDDNNGKSDNKSNGNSNKRDKDQRK